VVDFEPKINKLVTSTASAISNTSGHRNKVVFLLNQIRADDDMLYELENYLESQKYDLDKLAFYVKCLEFKSGDSSSAMLSAGLIIDNYLGEEAEYYVGGAFSNEMIRRIEHRFEQVIASHTQEVPKDLFDECLKVAGEDLEPLVK
jgi:hypothetical protein